MKKYFIFIAILLLFSSITEAATISGKIYNLDLNLEKNVVLEINTEPKQTFVSKDGSYSFNVPLGNYLISAKSSENYIEEELSVRTEGTYNLDLIIWPSLEEEDELIENIDYLEKTSSEKEIILQKDQSHIILYIFTLITILIIYIIISKKNKFKKLFLKENSSIKKNENFENKYIKQIIEILEHEGGRTSQKNIRKHIPLSEAKISLILAELEHNNKIQKFKKGRANIVVLKK